MPVPGDQKERLFLHAHVPLSTVSEGSEKNPMQVLKHKLKRLSLVLIPRVMEEEDAVIGRMEDGLEQEQAEASTDVYSSQFESILDNVSLYYSAESLETLYSEPESFFSFEMPLTPMIQQRIKEDAHFLERTPDREIGKGDCAGIANGLGEAKESDTAEGDPLER